MGATVVSETQAWRQAVGSLRAQIEAWAPAGVSDSLQPYDEDPSVSVLILSSDGSRRLSLVPASYRLHKTPVAVDLVSSTLARVRFVGPQADGTWKVYTSDGVELSVGWNQAEIARLCTSLLAA